MEENIALDAPEEHIGAVQYVGFWPRLAAYLLDNLILSIPTGIIFSAFFIPFILGRGSSTIMTVSFFISYVFVLVLVTLLQWLYAAIMESSGQQGTFGKKALGIKVTDLNGERISFARATGRHFSKILSSFFYIGFIMVGFDARKQGLHDKIAGTLVVYK